MPGLWICQGYTALQRRLNMSEQCLNIPKYARIVKSVLVVAVYIRYPSILRTLTYSEPDAYSEPCQRFTIVRIIQGSV